MASKRPREPKNAFFDQADPEFHAEIMRLLSIHAVEGDDDQHFRDHISRARADLATLLLEIRLGALKMAVPRQRDMRSLECWDDERA